MMDSIKAGQIRLVFDDFELRRDYGEWTVWRGGLPRFRTQKWEEAFDSLTTAERVRLTVFANSLK
jgi:hypothetical protein